MKLKNIVEGDIDKQKIASKILTSLNNLLLSYNANKYRKY